MANYITYLKRLLESNVRAFNVGANTGHYLSLVYDSKWINISNSSMLTLRATPYKLMDGIPGYIIYAVRILQASDAGVTPRTGSPTTIIQLRYGSNYFNLTGDLDLTTLRGVNANARVVTTGPTGGSGAYSISQVVGASVYLTNSSNSEFAGGATNNVLHIKMAYHLLKAED